MSCVNKRPKRTTSEEQAFQEHVKKVAQENGKLLGLEGDPDLQFLLAGGKLIKVRKDNWKKNRFFKLQDDCKTLWQESRKLIKRNQTFSLDDIDSVRRGRQSHGLNKHTDPIVEEQCFSIIFKGHKKTLDLMAPNLTEAKQWVNGLDKIINNMRNLSPQQNSEHWIFNCMRKADKNKDNKMNLKEVKHFMRQLNIEMDNTYAEEIFNKCDTSKSGTLEGSEIKLFYDMLTHREEIDVIYGNYAQTEGQMSARDLLNFLLNEQRELASMEDAVKLIEKYEVDGTAKQNKRMTKDGFLMYMNHDDSSILNPAHTPVYQDMHQPLNHYFISSSHNTYLMEDQLKGPSSTEAYIKALMKSCRCVELDCWDGANGEPVIYHGHTLTSKVLFKDVIKAIKEYAFKALILSLENHCNIEQQTLMANYLKSILGDALVTKPLGNTKPTNFPSPEELKGRFLVKGKRLNKLNASVENHSTVEEGTVSDEDEASECKEDSIKDQPKKSTIKLAKALSDVVVYCKSVHFKDFEHSKENHAFYEMSSFKESKALNLAETSATAYIHHNMDKLSRIYPAGSRTDSSNYNPVPLWNVGCQIGNAHKPGSVSAKRVISAQQLPKLNKGKHTSIVDPLVKVEIYGVPADTASKETNYINNNGFNPTWNEKFTFDINVPELAMLRLLVEDHDSASYNDFVGQYCLPLTSIQNGYRRVPLLTKRGDVICSAGLFLHLMLMDAK
ncbi:hypothetical protein FQN60_013690 [Etheostoma spectabile]|uniref:Phosphoinositide phospholipase C n=1 Tax=Etheostoma spectabile TaxID=54343 RepID=A0A5J5CFK2_9PERO|nr:hypothetical protein FQN60_013690 [Etheostoma spectabile]